MKLKTINKSRSGFTLIEVLIIVSIISLLVIAFTLSMRKQRLKAEDAKIKDDLYKIKIAFENYYNDNNCYPPIEWMEQCNSSILQPYLSKIPCKNKSEPYALEYDESGCNLFKILTNLHNFEDPSVQELCTYDGSGETEYNYGVCSTNTTVTINCTTPEPSPTPTPSGGEPGPLNYYCNGIDNCTSFPENRTCSPAFSEINCGGCTADKIGTCTNL